MNSNLFSLFLCAVFSFISLAAAADVERTISITATNKIDGLTKSLEISLGETSVTNTLFVAYDAKDNGDDIGAWLHVDPICVTTPETNRVVYTLPDDWGSETMAIRFSLPRVLCSLMTMRLSI